MIADNARALALARIGLLVALVGLVAVAVVLRTRWRVRHSLYAELWEERRRQLEEVRSRVRGGDQPADPEVDATEPAIGEPRVRESPRQALAGHLALALALVATLLGVVILVGGGR